MAGKAIELSVKSIRKHGNSQQAMFDYRRVYVDIQWYSLICFPDSKNRGAIYIWTRPHVRRVSP